MQQIAGETDRQAVGVEARYFVPGRTLLAMVDYDVHYQELNSAVLTGQPAAAGAMDGEFQRRSSPLARADDAQCAHRPAGARPWMSCSICSAPSEVEQLARDRTPLSDLFSVSISRPLGERFQFSFEALRAAASPRRSPPATSPRRRRADWKPPCRCSSTANNLAQANDLWVLSARYQDGALATDASRWRWRRACRWVARGASSPTAARRPPRISARRRQRDSLRTHAASRLPARPCLARIRGGRGIRRSSTDHRR